MWTKNEKKELQLFFVVTFGLTAIMAIFMGIGYYSHGDVKAAVLAQMLYPMVGVILAVLCNRRNESCVPRRVFGCILMITGLMIFCNICSAFFAHKLWETVSLAIIVLGSIACLGFYLFEEEEKINYYKLKNEKIVMKDYVKYSAIFVAVIILSELVELGMELVFGMKTVVEINNTIPSVEEIFSVLPSLLFSFIPSFFIQFIIFWGEEYGWRTFCSHCYKRDLE